jgi:hypothetical protein
MEWTAWIVAAGTLALAIATVVMALKTADMASKTNKLAQTANAQVEFMRAEVLRQAMPNIVVTELTWPSLSAGGPQVSIHLANAGPGEAYHIQSNGWVAIPTNQSKPAHATDQQILVSAGKTHTITLRFPAVAPEPRSLEFTEYVDLYTLITWQDRTGRYWGRATYGRYQGDREVPISVMAWPTKPRAQALSREDKLVTGNASSAEFLSEVKSHLGQSAP